MYKISLKMGKVTKWIVTLLLICFFTSNLALGNSEKEDRKSSILHVPSLQCRRILGGRNLVRVRNIVVAAIFDFMTVEDWGEYHMALSRANCALKENACTAG